MRVVLAVIPGGDRALRGEVDVAADVFDQRHLIALYQRGLINELPIELGPMPVFDLGPSVDEDLKRWNIVDPSTNELTEPAQEYFAGLVGYEWAVWGIVLLYNQRTEIVSESRKGGHDLVVLGTPLVGQNERLTLHGLVGELLEELRNLPVLIVRSRWDPGEEAAGKAPRSGTGSP